MTILTNQQERIRFLRFSAVGAFSAWWTLAFQSADPIDKYLTGIGYRNFFVRAAFLWNRYWTYPDCAVNLDHPVGQFLINSIGWPSVSRCSPC
jgi:putative flippase GtrA